MARRKVTMLEAFQASAKESAERAAAERRRVVAERERELRREETARAAQEFGQRLGAHSLTSWVAGLRDSTPAPTASSQAEAASLAEGTASESLAAGPASTAEVQSISTRAAELGVVDRAQRAVMDPGGLHPGTGPEDPRPSGVVGPPGEEAAGAPAGATAGAEAGAQGGRLGAGGAPEAATATRRASRPASAAIETATEAELEEAMAAIEDEVFSLPMRPRTVAWLVAGTLVAAFLVGLGVGRRSDAAAAPPASGAAAARFGFDPTVGTGAPVGTSGEAPSGLREDEALPARTDGMTGDQRVPDDSLRSGDAAADLAGMASSGAAPGLTAVDHAFLDPSMKYTVMAITYSDSENNRALLAETYDLLTNEGFPVVHPVRVASKKHRVFVFVGVSATYDELLALRDDLASLQVGSHRRRDFATAQIVNIDPYR